MCRLQRVSERQGPTASRDRPDRHTNLNLLSTAALTTSATASSVAASGAQTPTSPDRSMALDEAERAARSRGHALQDKFHCQGRSSIGSTNPGTPNGLRHAHTDSRSSRASSIYDVQRPEVQAHLRPLRKRDSMG